MFHWFNRKQKNTQWETISLDISGMHCASCALSIDNALEDLPGVSEAHTQYAQGKTKVVFDPEKVEQTALVKTLQELGYTAH